MHCLGAICLQATYEREEWEKTLLLQFRAARPTRHERPYIVCATNKNPALLTKGKEIRLQPLLPASSI